MRLLLDLRDLASLVFLRFLLKDGCDLLSNESGTLELEQASFLVINILEFLH